MTCLNICCLDKPEITDNVMDQVVIENKTNSVTFTCEAIGEPSPTLSWRFNNVMINQSDKYIMHVAGVLGKVESTLTTINPVSSDAGTYTCHAENVVGSDNSSGILTVNGKMHITSSVCIL